MLGGLALLLAGAGDGDDQGDVDIHHVLLGQLPADLADGLQKGLGLDIAYGAADLSNDHVLGLALLHAVNPPLDFVGDVGDHLDGAAQKFPLPLLVQDGGIHLARGDGRVHRQVLVHKPFVVAQVQIGLRAVVGDKYFSVLDGIHGSRVHVQIGVQLLQRHPQAPLLEQAAQGGGGDAFPQPGNHAPGDKDVFD